MKISRLFQPRNPLFWIMLAFNTLSMVLGWLVQNKPLNTFGLVVVGVFGVANAVLGMWLAWQLVRDPKAPTPTPAPATPPKPE